MPTDPAPLITLAPGVTVAPDQRVRVTRELVFEGTAEWIQAVMGRRWLRKGQVTRELIETTCRAEETRLVWDILPTPNESHHD